jgi:hypothetical protein
MFLRLTNAKTGRVSLYNLMHVDEISVDPVSGQTILWSTKPGIIAWRVKESLEQIEQFFIEIGAMKQ